MRIAATIFLTDRTVSPTSLARTLEERGFSGLYLPEHTHIPVARDTAAPMGGELPEMYGRTLDPFVALGQAAAVTERLHLGTGITLVAQHDPIGLAKQAATLDHLSGGRLTLGIGYGWNVEEAADHGVEWRTRRELVRDKMALMRALWAPQPTAYVGQFCSVEASAAYPKPVQAPRDLGGGQPLYGPRTLLGGSAGPKLFAAIADHGDGWMPIGGRGLTESLPVLREVWETAGRDPKSLRIVPYAIQPSPGKLAHYADLGIDEVVVQLPSATEAELLPVLDEFAQYL
ncbi:MULTISPECIES: TIGR03619 family F420-dependent LLM class oxidoreductase [unclassified Streptomyces]|uniref:TIGR03619 family F420-dependent LLM class oxidoreductase n=1 Tax=unclassified Streptomyces TaxID=2593676 RepID=UPI002254D92A|nr:MULTISPECIES: TIGR03619 family F420-dependent LLM class oxidoreductase [unclassified Streptomyces]MCX4526383.1 TIGR03619 family F420-dependent LLM class oxidoreductase [Streptomyces sp. NBC_01551]MCX4543054.1 TIGR03619 family F420-dependent LLM class oxidoreductase [Streptomyces sp. NBC_01565]